MKNFLLLLSVLCFFSCHATSEGENTSSKMILFEHNGLYGYLDENLHVVCMPKYISASKFVDGYAVVEEEDYSPYIIDEEYNQIDLDGYAKIEHLFNDVFLCTKNQISRIIRLRDMHILAEEISISYHTYTDNIIQITTYGEDSKAIATYLNYEGETITTHSGVGYPMSNGVALIRTPDGWGILNIDGQIFNVGKFEPLSRIYSNELLPVKMNDGKTGYMDTTGNLNIEVNFWTGSGPKGLYGIARSFSNERAFIMTSEEPDVFHIIDIEGNYVSEALDFDFVEEPSEGFSPVAQEYTVLGSDGIRRTFFYWGYMRYDGEILIDTVLDSLNPSTYEVDSFHNGYARIKYKGRDGLLNNNGNVYWSDDLVLGNIMAVDASTLTF